MTVAVESTELVQVANLNAVELFTGNAMDPLVGQIKAIVDQHVPDVSTATGRKAIASLAFKVSRSKVILDDLGKDLVADWKEKAKKVDAVRKKMRDELDALRDYARQPLTAWEEQEAARERQKQLDAEYDQAWVDAHAEHGLRERERIVREKEAEFARQEAERKAKEDTERLERERKEREERIAREAAERATREAEEAIAREKARAERAERERIEAEARAKAEQEAAVRAAEQRAKAEAERKERERLAAELAEEERREKLAANKRHRERIEREARDSLVSLHYNPDMAYTLIQQIAEGKIKNVTINY